MTSWEAEDWNGVIEIGDYVLISPGVRIMAADKVLIGNSCMFGHGACITDADWHGIYDRTKVVGDPKPVVLEENLWVGEDAMICKGVKIGANSIIVKGIEIGNNVIVGALTLINKNIPDNSFVKGNPMVIEKLKNYG